MAKASKVEKVPSLSPKKHVPLPQEVSVILRFDSPNQDPSAKSEFLNWERNRCFQGPSISDTSGRGELPPCGTTLRTQLIFVLFSSPHVRITLLWFLPWAAFYHLWTFPVQRALDAILHKLPPRKLYPCPQEALSLTLGLPVPQQPGGSGTTFGGAAWHGPHHHKCFHSWPDAELTAPSPLLWHHQEGLHRHGQCYMLGLEIRALWF